MSCVCVLRLPLSEHLQLHWSAAGSFLKSRLLEACSIIFGVCVRGGFGLGLAGFVGFGDLAALASSLRLRFRAGARGGFQRHGERG